MKNLFLLIAGGNVLITTDGWFYAPDGKLYRAVWGKVEIHTDEATLGVKTNAHSTNWYALVGSEDKRVIIAGCQIKYACVCLQKPNTNAVEEQRVSDNLGKDYTFLRDCNIYLAQ